MAKTVVLRSYFALLIAALVLVPNIMVVSRRAFAYTPDDPVVRRMVTRGAAFLESHTEKLLGGKAVVALALVKANKPPDHPLILGTAEEIKAKIAAAEGDPSKLVMDKEENDNYSIGTSAIFLLSYDAGTYRAEIQFLLDTLAHRQKEHGGWGYVSKIDGDTSMTQYAVLTMWEAHQEGFSFPPAMLNGVATWLAKTQDPSGAFGYQGQVSPTFEPIKQYETRLSMVVAGLGSTYICTDLMGLGRKPKEKNEEPSALKEVEDTTKKDLPDTQRSRPKKISISLESSILRRVQERGNRYMAKKYEIAPSSVAFKYYYLYALERYCSFRELDEGKGNRKDGPKWYNDGVDYLMVKQTDSGGWDNPVKGEAGPSVSTAFAILFLVRSTQKSIQGDRGYGPGTLVGGRGFPDEGEVVIRNGQVIAKPTTSPFEAMQSAMKNPGEADLAEAIDRMDELGPKQSQILVSKFAEKLRALVSDPSPDNRIAAVKALGRSGNLENAPILILALDDKDSGVVLEARDGLRRMSRKIGGFGLPDKYTPSQHSQAVKKWRAWYKELQPDAEF
ncbi:MAG: HEAT repeat domain-containing protein [Pirellulales bacterium]|nr:HEAT repeat domain-containing protein [Pirellulales bacterium]